MKLKKNDEKKRGNAKKKKKTHLLHFSGEQQRRCKHLKSFKVVLQYLPMLPYECNT
jgi:hypothetical protein